MNPSGADLSWRALVLTHRRGGLVALFSGAKGETVSTQSAIAVFSDVLESPSQQASGFRIFFKNNAAVAIGDSTTAEVLAAMYRHVLGCCGMTDADVGDIGVGIGPGSFTGLRLGCAFVNGLQCGRGRRLWEIECAHLASFFEMVVPHPSWSQPIPVDVSDEYSVPVTLMDFHFALQKWPQARLVTELQPAYGRLPGPVIKLQNEATKK